MLEGGKGYDLGQEADRGQCYGRMNAIGQIQCVTLCYIRHRARIFPLVRLQGPPSSGFSSSAFGALRVGWGPINFTIARGVNDRTIATVRCTIFDSFLGRPLQSRLATYTLADRETFGTIRFTDPRVPVSGVFCSLDKLVAKPPEPFPR
jgi:hypothetical protein